MKYFIFVLSFVVLLFAWTHVAQAQGPLPLEYVSPRPEAELVSAGTTIAVRQGEEINADTVAASLFQVVGTRSGSHSGQALLADDDKTVIFTPDRPFSPGETVTVTIGDGLTTVSGEVLEGTTFEFKVSPKDPSVSAETFTLEKLFPGEPLPEDGLGQTQVISSPYVTLPGDWPDLTVTVPANGTDDGYLFLSLFRWATSTPSPFQLILDNSGEPVYYRPQLTTDFKKQPNNLLSYFDTAERAYKVLDASYSIVGTYAAGNGYTADLHELQFLPDNGHALLMIYDDQPVNMSQIVPGGVPTATVTGLVIQELDTSKNVVFQWRSWDHFNITDTVISLTTPVVDYVHGNAIERDFDGNLLISSRHLNEITKINRQTGEVMWRWGGNRNEFTFTNTDPFFHQHDIRRLPNGHVTLFDNGNTRTPAEYSRAVEFELDEINKVATSVWEFRNTPNTFSFAMGNTQRLPNGNTLIGWGSRSSPGITEVKANGDKAFELAYAAPWVSYRAFRFPWEGFPSWPPTLVTRSETPTTTLFYSWNGATNVAYYRIYGGKTLAPDTLIASQLKGGFENSYDITGLLEEMCYFRVMPVDTEGVITQYSNVVLAENSICARNSVYLPMLIK